MRKAHFKNEIKRQFDQLESSAQYYWSYLRELQSFKFIAELSYEAGLISHDVYKKSLEFCGRELKRYV